jgi:hypothetical protein
MLQRLSILFVILQVYTASCSVLDNRVEEFQASDGSCNLPAELTSEISQYQPIVDQIVSNIVNGQFAGKTWER